MLAMKQVEDGAMRWLDGLRTTLEPYPWVYTLLVLAALLLAMLALPAVKKKREETFVEED